MKKVAVLMVVVLMLAAFAGCDSQPTPTERVRPSESAVATSEQVSETAPVMTEAPVITTTEAPQEEVDPIAIYEVTTREGIFFLARRGKNYALCRTVRPQSGVDYYAGNYRDGRVRFSELTSNDYQDDSGQWIEERFIYSGLPIVEIQDGDHFTGVSDSGEVPTMWYSPVLAIRYTVDSRVGDDVYEKNLFMMTDSRGNTVDPEQYGDLEQGEMYTLSWYEGTVYHEEHRVADAMYVTMYNHKDEFAVQGKLTKKGYAIYDIGDLEPGLYMIEDRLVRIP